MKWVGIVGARRIKYPQVESDVRGNVSRIFAAGNAIVSGGAPGVDFLAVDEALKHDLSGTRIRVILPSSLKTYREYFNGRIQHGFISQDKVDALMGQLREVKSRHPKSLIEMHFRQVCRQSFHARNAEVVRSADELEAYQAARSAGTMNAVHHARVAKIPVTLYNYE